MSQKQFIFQVENNKIYLVEVKVEISSIKSGIIDCIFMSKEDDKRKKSKALEVFEKSRLSKVNNETNLKSHVQPIDIDKIRKRYSGSIFISSNFFSF